MQKFIKRFVAVYMILAVALTCVPAPPVLAAEVYSISYNLMGGSVSGNPTTYTEETATFTLNNPTREGYVFTGWTGLDIATPKKEVIIPQGTKGNLTFTAHWDQLIAHSINYVLNGGVMSGNPVTYSALTETFTLNNPTRTGYTFAGWTGSNGTTPQTTVTIQQGRNEDLRFIANWTLDTYTIGYNLKGGSVAGNPATYNYNTESFTLNNPIRTGATFTGWTGSNGTTPQTTVTIPQGSTGSRSYTANWDLEVHSITYDLDGGTAYGNPTSYTVDSFPLTLNAPVKAGYTFVGWTGSNGTVPQTRVTVDIWTAEDLSFTANWNMDVYTIAYYLGGGTIEGENPTTYSWDTPSFTLENPTREGYSFVGWTGSNGVTPQKTVTVSEGSTGDRTYIANWTQDVYTITYNLEGGTVTGNPVSYTYETSTFSLRRPVRSGYTFTGWTGSNGTEPQIDIEVEQGTIGDLVYTAHWSEQVKEVDTYTITYHLNGGTVTGNPATYTAETSTFTLNQPIRSGYTFVGWTGSNGDTPQKVITIKKGTAGNLVYAANWEQKPQYPITYHLNGGIVTTNPVSYHEDTETFTLNNPTRSGYTFVGWSGSNGSIPQTTVTIPTGSTGERDYVANWVIITYDITYNLDGGTANGNPISYTVETEDFTLNNPTRSGYTFTGWTGSNGTAAQETVTVKKGTTGSLSYTANWTPVEPDVYTITYNLVGGTSAANPSSYTVETEDFTLKNPTRTGYIFIGWTGSNGNTPQTTVTIPKGSTGNRSYTANWRAEGTTPDTPPLQDGYTITYNLDGGTNAANPTSYTENTETFVLGIPSRRGYTFVGWTGSTGSVEPVYAMIIRKGTTGNLTFTANWALTQYVISYSLAGGKLDAPVSRYTIESESFVLPTPTKSGYTFAGWTGSNGATVQKTVTVAKGTSGHLGFTAHWRAGENPITGTISYTKRIGDGAFRLNVKAATALSYKSSNEKVCTVSSKGKVTIKGTGTAKITVTANETADYPKETKKITVKVKKLSAVSITSATRKSAAKAVVKWKKNSKGDGYQIQCSRTEKFKTKTTRKARIGSKNTNWANVIKLKSKRCYYVRIRAYKDIDGKRFYSDWSKVKVIPSYGNKKS